MIMKLNAIQHKVVSAPLSNKIWLEGSGGSGKTDALINRYQHLFHQGMSSKKILVIVVNRAQHNKWSQRLNLPKSGSLEIFSYFGFVQRELKQWWPLVQEKMPPGNNKLEPDFMTIESSHYLLTLLVEQARNKNALLDVTAGCDRIAIQIADNFVKAAVNNISYLEVEKRLSQAYPGHGEKISAFREMQNVMKDYRNLCISHRILDYPLCVELYQQVLLKISKYQSHLGHRYRHLIVDNCEEMVPTAQDLILELLKKINGATIAYNPDGGFSTFFGAAPTRGKELIYPQCDSYKMEQSYTCSEAAYQAGNTLYDTIALETLQTTPTVIRAGIAEELRGDMINWVVETAIDLLNRGGKPGEIVIIAPFVDKVLEFSLKTKLEAQGYSIENLVRLRRLIDETYTQALITMVLLAHPQWGRIPSFTDISDTISLLLKIDKIRSSVIARIIYLANPCTFVPLDEVLKKRVGSNTVVKYQLLVDWLNDYIKSDPLSIDIFMEKVFVDLLIPLLPDRKDINSCRMLIDAAQRFILIMKDLEVIKTENIGKQFIDMVHMGTLSAERLHTEEIGDEAVRLNNCYSYLMSGQAAKYQIWVDISSNSWFRSDAKELTNPHIFNYSWDEHHFWDDFKDMKCRLENGAKILRGLLHKCQKGIFVSESLYNTSGYEQSGVLPEYLDRVMMKGEKNDKSTSRTR